MVEESSCFLWVYSCSIAVLYLSNLCLIHSQCYDSFCISKLWYLHGICDICQVSKYNQIIWFCYNDKYTNDCCWKTYNSARTWLDDDNSQRASFETLNGRLRLWDSAGRDDETVIQLAFNNCLNKISGRRISYRQEQLPNWIETFGKFHISIFVLITDL